MSLKADISRLNLPQEPRTTKKSEKKLKIKMDMLRRIGKQPKESVKSVPKEKKKATGIRREGFAEQESFKPGVKERRSDVR